MSRRKARAGEIAAAVNPVMHTCGRLERRKPRTACDATKKRLCISAPTCGIYMMTSSYKTSNIRGEEGGNRVHVSVSFEWLLRNLAHAVVGTRKIALYSSPTALGAQSHRERL